MATTPNASPVDLMGADHRRRVQQSIDECTRYIDKESPRSADLRPPEIASRLDWYIAHRAKLQDMLAAGNPFDGSVRFSYSAVDMFADRIAEQGIMHDIGNGQRDRFVSLEASLAGVRRDSAYLVSEDWDHRFWPVAHEVTTRFVLSMEDPAKPVFLSAQAQHEGGEWSDMPPLWAEDLLGSVQGSTALSDPTSCNCSLTDELPEWVGPHVRLADRPRG